MALRELVEARNKYEEKSALLAKIQSEAALSDGTLDYSRVKAFGDDFAKLGTVKQVEKVRELNTELIELFDTMKKLDLSDIEAGVKMREKNGLPRNPMVHSETKAPDSEGLERKSIGEFVAGPESDFRKKIVAGDLPFRVKLDDVWPSQIDEIGLKSVFPLEKKTLFETGAGWAPENIRLPGWVDAPTRPIAVVDTIPAGRTTQAAIVYMLETTRTHAAAEKAEGAAYAESTFVLTATTQVVEKITDSIPVTDEQLADVSQAETYLRSRLMFGIRQRLDLQILVGDGNTPNLLGANNVASINTQPKATDPVPDAVYKGMDLIRTVGFAVPGVVYSHPNDWQGVRLLRTVDGMYIWGNPSEAGPMRIWGVPVVVTTAQTQNTMLIIDNSPAMCMLFERAGVLVEVGYVGDQFKEGKRTLRAQMRAAMVWFRVKAITTVTGV